MGVSPRTWRARMLSPAHRTHSGSAYIPADRFERQTVVPQMSQASRKLGTYGTGRSETAMQMSPSIGRGI